MIKDISMSAAKKKKKSGSFGRAFGKLFGTVLVVVLITTCLVFVASRFLADKAVKRAEAASIENAISAEKNLLQAEEKQQDSDLRVLNVYYPLSDSTALGKAVQSEMDGIADTIISTHSAKEKYTLTLMGKEVEGPDCAGVLLLCSDGSGDKLSTLLFSLSGQRLSNAEAFTDMYDAYISDYLTENIRSDSGLLEILSENYTDYIAAESGNFEMILPCPDGTVDVFFAPNTLTTEDTWARLNIPANVMSGEYYSRRRVDPAKPMVAITYDDGPNDTSYPAILDILEQYGAVATFFDVGRNVEKYPEMTARAYAIGCEIGSHTYNHINIQTAGEYLLRTDKEAADAAFINSIGEVPYLVRPPEGVIGGQGKWYYENPFIGWSCDTEDWLNRNVGSIVWKVEGFGNLDGQVILMHSIYDTTATASQEIIPWLINQGYQLVTVSELLKYHYGVDPIEPHLYYAVDFFLYGRPAV